jgi:predicted Na+-dependent transporter
VILENILKEERTLGAGLLACGIVAGLAAPQLCLMMKPYALIGLFMVIIFSLVPFSSLPLNSVFAADKSVIRLVGWQQVVLPCIITAIGTLAKFPDSIIAMMVVTATAGSVFASPAFAALLGLDRRLALQSMVLSTLFTPISLYIGLFLLLGTTVDLDIAHYLQRTAIFLGLPMVIFLAYRQLAIRLPESTRPPIELTCRWAGLVALLVFGLGVMADLSAVLQTEPMKVVLYLGITTVICIVMLAITTIVMFRFGLTEALTSGILAAFRNVGLGFALVGDSVNTDLDIYVGVSMLPLFLAPIVLRIMTTERSSIPPLTA